MAKKAPIEEKPVIEETVIEETPVNEKMVLIPETPEPPRETPPTNTIKQLNEIDIQKEVEKQVAPLKALIEGKPPVKEETPNKIQDFGFFNELGDLL